MRADIERSIKQYELIKLDTVELAAEVRRTGKLSFNIPGESYEIELVPNDMRAPNYRAEEVGADGKTRPVEPGPVRTYKGRVIGMEGAEARFTIDDEGIEGLIATPGATHFIEPASRYSPTAGAADFVFYDSTDVLAESEAGCGVTLAETVNSQAENIKREKALPQDIQAEENRAAAPPPPTALRVVELATEADYELVSDRGGSAKTNEEILSIMNQVDGIYKAELGVTFTIVYQHTWATVDDPYTSPSATGTLNEFTNYWNANQTSVSRDLAHIFTFRSLNDYIGYAWIGVTCSTPNLSYALSLARSWRPATLVAHEIGHNFGAAHVDTTSSCENTIMISGVGWATTFCDFSRNQINNYIASFGSCLSVSAASCTYTLSATGQTFGKDAGAGSVSVTAGSGCNWVATSNNEWINIVGLGNSNSPSNFVGNGNATINYIVSANPSYTRKGTISVAGQTYTVTQAGAFPACPVQPIQPGQTINGTLSAGDCGSAWLYYYPPANSYSFSGTAGQQLRISSSSQSFTPQLFLVGPDGARVSSSNGNGGAANAYLPSANSVLTLPLTGTYVIEVTSWGSNQTGAYTLTLSEPCTYSLSPGSQNFSASGGGGSVSVTTTGGCAWTAVSNNTAFITITSGTSGNGNGTVNYSVAANPTQAPRTGTITIAGQTFTVTQDGATCSFSIATTSQNFLAGGVVSENISVTTAAGCAWTIASNAQWITVTGSSSMTGSGVATYSVAPNTGPARTGTLTVAGQTLTITQASGCAYLISPVTRNHVSGGGASTASVTTDAACPWTAASNDSFITITSGTSGTGNGTVSYSVAPNPNTSLRTGTMTIAGQTFTVTQDGAPPPLSIQLSQASYTVSEGAGFLNINAIRSGDTSAPATVKYATGDATDANFRCEPNTPGQPAGVASRKCDYHIAVGTLRFASGEASKQFTLSIVNDVYVEGPESFTLTLSNATGALLGQNNNVTVTITDDDAAGAANPIDNTSFFVRQLYVDLLSREPDPAGWNGWTTRINLCGQPGQAPPPCDRVTVGGDGFLRSGEFFDRQFFVLRLYRTGLGRILRYDEIADLAYVSGFLTAEQLELNKQELVAEMVLRDEFAGRYNPLSNAGFVPTLVQTAGVSIPQSVQDAWIAALDNNSKTRAQVYREISERQEVSDRYLHEAQVVSAYYGFFTRNPDGAYLNYLQRLDSGEINLADLANAFINAQEYRSRFGQ